MIFAKKRIITYKKLLKKSINYLINKYGKENLEISKASGGIFYFVKNKNNLNLDIYDKNQYLINDNKNYFRVNITTFKNLK